MIVDFIARKRFAIDGRSPTTHDHGHGRAMSRSFVLGSGTPCNVDALIDTRLLIQANSGGGKSWCLRRVLEQTHGAVQHLVIDPEGEFASLREKFDYVLAARSGGDTSADPRTAKLLAERGFALEPRSRGEF